LDEGQLRQAKAAWFVALGESDDYATARSAMQSREFRAAEGRLRQYVENYSKHLARRDIKSEGH